MSGNQKKSSRINYQIIQLSNLYKSSRSVYVVVSKKSKFETLADEKKSLQLYVTKFDMTRHFNLQKVQRTSVKNIGVKLTVAWYV